MKELAIIKIWGGIGNQLFQYVFGQYLHFKYNIEVKYDINSFLSTDKLRNPELSALNVEVAYDNRCSLSRCRGIKNRILQWVFQIHPKHHFINELAGIRRPKQFKSGHLYFFQGYWQNINYYSWLKENIPNYSVELEEWPEQLLRYKALIDCCCNSLSVHIRRGDYFSPKHIGTYGVCDASYFEHAIEFLQKKQGKCQLFIFSDDIDWVKENISLPDDAVIIENYDVPQFAYIYLMSLCKHHIISNSSFSWWGAVLNDQTDGMVIAPKRWTLTSDKTIALDKWVRI